MASNLTFYFAWVADTDTTFNSSFARFDEDVFSLNISCAEGQIPKATLEIRNPRVGLLSVGRQRWAWISMSDDGGTTLTPIFFGHIVGIPKSILNNTVKVDFVARAKNFVYQKQQVAETLKRFPEYDPLFMDVLKRDDPDAILEGWSRLYAIDRITNEVSASDILIGEDGTITLAPEDVYYDSVVMTLQQSPLKAVNVKAQVAWRQQYTGFFNVGTWSYPTLGNEAFVNDWPKSGATIGGGYSGAISWAGVVDPYVGMPSSSNFTISYTWQNRARQHNYGDTMSISFSASRPTKPMQMYTTLEQTQIAILNPYATDAGGNPAPVNQPFIYRAEAVGVATFALDYAGRTALATLGLRYDANRQRYERAELTVIADVQSVDVDPQVTEVTETITLKSGDLGVPVTDFRNWSSVAGTHVDVGDVIFPDNPLVAGQSSSQLCVTAGTTGTVEPIFSNVAGETTVDNGAVWVSLGDTPPVDSVQDWQSLARVPLGTMIVPKPVSGAPDVATLVALGNLGLNSRGVPTAKYTIYAENLGGPGDTMLECVQGGIYGGISPQQVQDLINSLPPGAYTTALGPISVSPSQHAVFEKFTNPSGQSIFIAVQAGISGEFRTTFDETPGALTNDGSVTWLCLGTVSLPIGGWPGMTPAPAYFPTDRGQQSVQHMICRARAKLRHRARAVQVSFQCRLDAVAATISCRMNAAITDARLPGGGAAGKVVSYRLCRDGDRMETYAEVVIGCTIGNGYGSSSSTAIYGTATYVDGVFDPGTVQVWVGASVSLVNNPDDIGYSPPVSQPVDDGLSFPLYGPGDVVLVNQWHGFASTVNPFNIAAYQIEIDATVRQLLAGGSSSQSSSWEGGSYSVTFPVTNYASLAASLQTRLTQMAGQGTSLWYELALKSLTNGPYSASYVISTTKLSLPMTMDLSATSGG